MLFLTPSKCSWLWEFFFSGPCVIMAHNQSQWWKLSCNSITISLSFDRVQILSSHLLTFSLTDWGCVCVRMCMCVFSTQKWQELAKMTSSNLFNWLFNLLQSEFKDFEFVGNKFSLLAWPSYCNFCSSMNLSENICFSSSMPDQNNVWWYLVLAYE